MFRQRQSQLQQQQQQPHMPQQTLQQQTTQIPQQHTPASASPDGGGVGSSPFTTEQIAMFKNQVLAFKSLSKNSPIPPNVRNALFNQHPLHAQQQSSPQLGHNSPQQNSPLLKTRQSSRTPSVSSPAVNQMGGGPPPETPFQKLGVSDYVDPLSYLSSSVSFEQFSKRQQQLFIPSLMPVGLDPVAMKEERNRQINDMIAGRIDELSKKLEKGGLKEEEQVDVTTELKKLKLVNYIKALRGDFLAQVYYFNTVGIDENNRNHFVRMRRPMIQDAAITEKFDMDQRHHRMVRENQKKMEHLNTLCKHAEAIASDGKVKRSKQLKLGKAVTNYHAFIEKEEQKRVERTAKQRLQALKANDEEAYIKLLDQTKDTRITHLLKQTNTFLDSLAEAVKTQQKETRAMVSDAPEGVLPDDEADAREKVDYYAVAHRVKEEVKHQPSILVGGELKEYQMKGLQWMVSLYNNNLNGILADEMGLGKTIQTISLITYLIETKNIAGPYLVIVPLSTLTNWNLEFEKWAPSVKKVVYKGPPLARKAQQATIRAGEFQVLLTTYEYIIKDRPLLSRIRWVHMIIDEGHRMKNSQSKLSSTLTTYYSSKYRLILTGTPLQNNLPELWALLNFVLPKIFNSVKSFDEWFNTPFANTGSQDKMDLSEEETLLIIRRLHKVLRPFLLRRLKKDVEKDLPDKVERVIKCKMSALQAKLYQQMVKHRVLFLGENAQGATAGGLKGLNNQIMQLRKICNHPYVFEEVENLVNPNRITNDDLWRTAGKFELLDRILPKFKASGHRVLIFFQMTQIMDIMEDFLRLRGLGYLRLDGGTKAEERSELLKLFNAPDSPYFAFLLSTRAGGLGLNLQSADTVIIYDTDWNPHQDLQAQDRAHRIGQTNEVRILRLITENSVEENILERAHKKLDIDGKVIQAGKFDNKSTSEEQEAFLRSLLEQEEAKRSQKDDDDDDLDDDELNEILSRNDDEKITFRAIDRERIANEQYPRRLFTDEELPEAYKRDITEHLKPEPVEHYGRGARERKVTHYDDGLTEEQWLEAVDNDEDTLEEAIARKRARITKRKSNKLKKELGTPGSPNSVSDTGSPSTPGAVTNSSPQMSASGGGVKRKRSRKTRAEIEAATQAAAASQTKPEDVVLQPLPPRKKAKGRPPKIKETLSPEARRDLNLKMQVLYDHILTVQDENGRNRIDLFLELPSKRIYPDYYVLIQNPVACDIISKRMNNCTYQRLGEFLADFKLMFDNARLYNEEGSIVYEDANELEREFNRKLQEIVPGIEIGQDGTIQKNDEHGISGPPPPPQQQSQPQKEQQPPSSDHAPLSAPPQQPQPELQTQPSMDGNGIVQPPSVPTAAATTATPSGDGNMNNDNHNNEGKSNAPEQPPNAHMNDSNDHMDGSSLVLNPDDTGLPEGDDSLDLHSGRFEDEFATSFNPNDGMIDF